MGIVSIFGEKNTGKSFIMNHILGDDQAFPVKSVGENSVFTSFNHEGDPTSVYSKE